MEPRYVRGVGMTRFSVDDRSTISTSQEAVSKALADADMKVADIDAVVLSTEDTRVNDERQRHYSAMLASILKRKIPIIRVEAVCGGGGAAFWSACRMKYNNMLVLGVDKVACSPTPLVTKEIMNAGDNFWEQEEGLVFPAINALVAQQHFTQYGTTHEDLELISFKNHSNGALNPNAYFYKRPITLDTIKKGPMVASPFTLFDCSISVNGAAAAIISHDEGEIKVKASALNTDRLAPFERESLTEWKACTLAAKEAFKQADLSPKDIHVAEIHDAFTIVELIAYEDLGFAKKGEGAKLIRDGTVNLDGKMPVNTSGGLKARGHPISPTGVAQIVEIADQLRNKCGDRQVSSPKYGLAHNVGGAGGTISVHIFGKR
ncbi:thiolase domain-containing protein [Candidatus Woesearchaeota archaeon]|nr:thiolase domain-containing protein [Candidatus Woesearchaeota archaeon]